MIKYDVITKLEMLKFCIQLYMCSVCNDQKWGCALCYLRHEAAESPPTPYWLGGGSTAPPSKWRCSNVFSSICYWWVLLRLWMLLWVGGNMGMWESLWGISSHVNGSVPSHANGSVPSFGFPLLYKIVFVFWHLNSPSAWQYMEYIM